jgi:lipopolysaccharide/colanic/teichoic acid biosynthesis glycosyltransferase
MTTTRYIRVKRMLDILAAALLFLFFAPLITVVALLIRIDSSGPAFYRQRRVGRNDACFSIWKFRSMYINAPVMSTEEMRRSGILPITRVGKFLRKTSLDELPQLINILKGEMSFIGPRPALPSQTDVNELRKSSGISHVTPGITGLAQVMGRDDLDTITKVKYDVLYCAQMSFWSDLKIIILTLRAVVLARGNK